MNNELYNLLAICGTVLLCFIGVIPYFHLARQAKLQRRMDYLREQQHVLRDAVAEYAGWTLRWNEPGQGPHGAKVCSIARSVMVEILDPQLSRFAGQLKLKPSSEEDNQTNQQALDSATMRLAELFAESWRNAGK
jgi:hypothetical protein